MPSLYRRPHFWSDQVSSAQEFYDHADEHFGWAETAKTERERAIFLQMAAAWLEVAQIWEFPFQVDGRFLTKKFSDMTPDEIKAFEERLATMEAEEPNLPTFAAHFASPFPDSKDRA